MIPSSRARDAGICWPARATRTFDFENGVIWRYSMMSSSTSTIFVSTSDGTSVVPQI